ncbi:hypothetical protein EIP86_010426 [Pleurotus ostreatoroseus]|nr:hypothetical protein EIP86_010426 [Pleurotus ostreatoroseus]
MPLILQRCIIVLKTWLSTLSNTTLSSRVWLTQWRTRSKKADVVYLEIPREWRYWRGYYSRVDEELEIGDKSGDFVSPILASVDRFPSVKPDIDIFGIPRHSRKQRGWYIVKPWPTPSCSRSHRATTPLAVASALEIPPELFQRILDMADLEGRHVLSACGQVCRYWEKQCRPIQFKQLCLQSRQDVMELCSFMEDPSSLFTPYLHRVDIAARSPSEPPWIHRFTKVWDRSPWKLKLEGPLPAGWKTMRSIHQAFPRSLPRHSSRNIDSLYLNNIRFRHLLDLAHLVCELPQLTTLRCLRVTWQALPATIPRQPVIQRNRLRRWEARECGLTNARAAVLLFRSAYPSSAFFSGDDLSNVLALADALDLSQGEEVAFSLSCEDDRLHFAVTSLPAFRSPFFKLHGIPHYLLENNRTFRLVAIDVTPYAQNGSTAPIDWAALDTVTTRLTLLQRLVLGFRDYAALQRFNDEIMDPQMQQSSTRGIVRYSVLKDGLWFRAGRDADELQGRGCMYLQDVHV